MPPDHRAEKTEKGGDAGEGGLGYVAISLLVAAVMGGMVAADVPGTVASAISSSVCRVTQTQTDKNCDIPGKAAAANKFNPHTGREHRCLTQRRLRSQSERCRSGRQGRGHIRQQHRAQLE